jgi:hypothetical protein
VKSSISRGNWSREGDGEIAVLDLEIALEREFGREKGMGK